jgi:predicted transcriptional regulator
MAAATRTFTAQVPTPLAEQVDQLADELERSRQWIVKRALVLYVAREQERRRLLKEAMDEVDQGRLVSMEQMDAWAASLDTDNELPTPTA